MNYRRILPLFLSSGLAIALTFVLSSRARLNIPPVVDQAYARLTAFVDPESSWCAAKANLWVEELRRFGIPNFKVVLFYAHDSAKRPHGWGYHIAPAVQVEGNTYVLEKSTDVTTPLTLGEWMRLHAGEDCLPATADDVDFRSAFTVQGKNELMYQRRLLPGSRCRYLKVTSNVSYPGKDFYEMFYNGFILPKISRETLIYACSYVIGEPIVKEVVQGKNIYDEEALARGRARCEKWFDGLPTPKKRSRGPASEELPEEISLAYLQLTNYRDSLGQLCAKKADLWALELQKRGFTTEKAFLFFTLHGKAKYGKFWDFHVAPVVRLNGQIYVFEKSKFIKRAMTFDEWSVEHAGQSCVPADSTNQSFQYAFRKESNLSMTYQRTLQIQPTCLYATTPIGVHSPDESFFRYFFRGESAPSVDRGQIVKSCIEILREINPESLKTGGNGRKRCEAHVDQLLGG